MEPMILMAKERIRCHTEMEALKVRFYFTMLSGRLRESSCL